MPTGSVWRLGRRHIMTEKPIAVVAPRVVKIFTCLQPEVVFAGRMSNERRNNGSEVIAAGVSKQNIIRYVSMRYEHHTK